MKYYLLVEYNIIQEFDTLEDLEIVLVEYKHFRYLVIEGNYNAHLSNDLKPYRD